MTHAQKALRATATTLGHSFNVLLLSFLIQQTSHQGHSAFKRAVFVKFVEFSFLKQKTAITMALVFFAVHKIRLTF